MSGPLRRIRTYLCAAALLAIAGSAAAQSVTGTHGLATIPTARMLPDGSLVAGTGFVHRRLTDYKEGEYHYAPLYVSITYLPFVEIGFRFSRSLDSGQEALGDRMLLVRLRVLEERGLVPAIAVGAHDFLRSSESQTAFFNALYVVASKWVPAPAGIRGVVRGVDAHLGYGTDLLDATGHEFVGPFGGVAVPLIAEGRLLNGWDVLVEYNGRTLNVGQRIRAFGFLDVLGAVDTSGAPLASVGVHLEL